MRLTAEFLLVAVVWFCVGWAVAWKTAYYSGYEQSQIDDEERRADLDEARMYGGEE